MQEQQQEQQSSAALHAQAQASHHHGCEEDWDTNGCDGPSPDLDAPVGDDDDNEQSKLKCDWLTSISEPLGKPALTLEVIQQDGSFPPSSTSPQYYFFESQHPGQGAKYLTAKPFGIPPADVTNEEAEFHLRMTKFLTRLTKTEQEELAYFMRHVYNARDDTLRIFNRTRPPISTEDFNDFYLGGKKSITKHLPTPVVMKTEDQTHSYVTLTDVIQNMLGASTAVDQFQFETDMVPNGLASEFFNDAEPATISKTRAAYSLFLNLSKEEHGPDFVLYLWIKRWCDDFDPNNTKQSRNQVWLMTNTICPPHGENKGRNTFFMAIGQKGDDHQQIDKLFEEELSGLSSPGGKTFYHGGRRELIRVKAGKVCVCVDRPERASLYQIGDHTGTFSTLWGHAVDVDGKCEDNCLPSCPFCRRKRLHNHLQIETNPSQDKACPNDCVSWNVMDSKFTSAAPADYPTVWDERPGAPLPPPGREISASGERRLPCIYLTIPWLKQAVIFAHHQLKTNPPDSTPRKRYWTKKQSTTFLRTCGIGSKLYDAIFASAQNGDEKPPLPYSWNPSNALQLTHYAAMHMLFLGHAKSNYDMVNKFHAHYKLSATFGKQANKILRDVQALRCNRFFDAQPLSTSTWGTGVWVSENYLFWVRCLKFFTTLPAVVDSKQVGKGNFDQDLRMVLRFCSSSLAAISRIMSERKPVGDMDDVVKIYLDTMVEMDRWLQETAIAGSGSSTGEPVSSTGVPPTGDATSTQEPAVSGTAAPPTRKRKKRTKESYNFCKSNSLGILSVAEAHRYLGPAILHWEGGWGGEKKIQPAKAHLGIKRANADWQLLVLQTLWREDELSWLIEAMSSDRASKVNNREMEGQLKIYANHAAVIDAIERCMPLSGMLAKDGSVWIAYRPTTVEYGSDTAKSTLRNWSRSALQMLKLQFDDPSGLLVSHSCWFAPITVVESDSDKMTLGSPQELNLHVNQYLLLLPKLAANDEYQNMYYVIGSKWTERAANGAFEQPQLQLELFKDWQLEVEPAMMNEPVSGTGTPVTSGTGAPPTGGGTSC